MLQMGGPGATKHGGDLQLEVKNKIETPYPRRDLQGDSQPGILSFQQKETIHRVLWVISKDCKSRSFMLTNFPTPSTFSCWKMRFKSQVSACSGYPSEAMLWIKEVEMVDSVDDRKSSRSIQSKTHFPNFEMLDAGIASALNKIIQNSNFQKKVSLEEQKAQKEDRFLRGKQIAYMIYDNFRVTVAS